MLCQGTGIVEDLAPVAPERLNVSVKGGDTWGGQQMAIVERRELRETRRQFVEYVDVEESDEKDSCCYATGET